MSMKFISYFAVLMACVLLTGCGFEPLYGGAPTASAGRTVPQGLDQVDINLIPNAEGVFLRNALMDRFYQSGYPAQPAYTLTIDEIKQSKSDFDITIDSEATRRQLTLSTRLILSEVGTLKPVLERKVKIVTSYDVIGSQFSTRIAEDDARKAALNDLARQIETHIALFLSQGR